VVVNRDLYETFEKMHWLCFHLEYEHNADPDEACGDTSSCPWHLIKVLKQELARLGHDPDNVLQRVLKETFQSPGAT
jgi:hypothetical protein